MTIFCVVITQFPEKFLNFLGHAMPIRSLTFSPDSQLLITASDDNHIKMYDVYHSIGFIDPLVFFSVYRTHFLLY